MPTSKPRINITITAQLYETVKRLSRLQGRSMSRTIVDLLEVTHPALQNVVAALEAVRRSEGESRVPMLKAVLDELRNVEGLARSVTGQPDMFETFENAVVDREIVRSRARAEPRKPVRRKAVRARKRAKGK